MSHKCENSPSIGYAETFISVAYKVRTDECNFKIGVQVDNFDDLT